MPLRGSVDRFFDGKRYCQPHSLLAFGYLRDNAYGRCTVPYPLVRSLSCMIFVFLICSLSSSTSSTGSTVTRSFCPLPSRMMIIF